MDRSQELSGVEIFSEIKFLINKLNYLVDLRNFHVQNSLYQTDCV